MISSEIIDKSTFIEVVESGLLDGPNVDLDKFINEVLSPVASFILLRWTEQQEASAETNLEPGSQQVLQLLPENLSWSSWCNLPAMQLSKFLSEQLWPELKKLTGSHPANVLRQLAQTYDPGQANANRLHIALSWVARQPFETVQDRQHLLSSFEFLICMLEIPILWQLDLPTFIPHQDGLNTVMGLSGLGTGHCVELIVELADPQPGESIYDPCFGTGTLLASAGRRVVEGGQLIALDNQVERHQRPALYGVDMQPSHCPVSMARLILSGVDRPHLEFGDAFRATVGQDFPSEGFDCIIAMPPFGETVSEESVNHFPIRTTKTENLFLQHIMDSLKPGGRAVVAIPERMLWRSGADARVRKQLLSEFCVEGILSLPDLKPFPSSIVVFRKSAPSEAVWFQRLSSKPADPREVADAFRSRDPNSYAWLTPTQEFSAGVNQLKDFELDGFLEYFRETFFDEFKEWVVKLSQIADIFPGVISQRQTKGPSPGKSLGFICPEDVADGKVKPQSRFISDTVLAHIKRTHRLQVGDLLMTASGEVALVPEAVSGAIPAKSVLVVRPKNDIHADFLQRILQSKPYQDWIRRHVRGPRGRCLAVRELSSLQIPIPPAEIQKRIFDLLTVRAGSPTLDHLVEAFCIGRNIHTASSLLLTDTSIDQLIALHGTPDEDDIKRTLRAVAKTLEEGLGRLGWENWEDYYVSHDDFRQWVDFYDMACHLSQHLHDAFDLCQGAERMVMLESLNSKLAELKDNSWYPDIETAFRGRAHAILDAIKHILAAERRRLLAHVEISPQVQPAIIDAGKDTEITIHLKNAGTLALLRLEPRVEETSSETRGDRMNRFPHFRVGEVVVLNYSVSARSAGTYPLTIRWSATRLDGEQISGEIPCAFEVRSSDATQEIENLGTSPYIVGSPIDRVEMFYGRRSSINEIKRQLSTDHRANVILLEGNRRVGKSSVLKHLELPGNLPGWIPVYCSLQGAEGEDKATGMSTNNLFYTIARALAVAVEKAGYPVEIPGTGIIKSNRWFLLSLRKALNRYFAENRPFELFEILLVEWLDKVKPNRILLMLDEFDKVEESIESGLVSPQVPENIRYLFHTYTDLSGILTGSRRLKKLREEYWSALFGFGYRIGLGPLEADAAKDLVEKPVSGVLVYVPEARDYVVDLCARQPFLIQSLSNRIFEYCADPVNGSVRMVSRGIVDKGADIMVEDNEHFQTLWDYVETERRRFLLCLIPWSSHQECLGVERLTTKLNEKGIKVTETEVGNDLDFLRELELVKLNTSGMQPSYELEIPLMRQWLEKHQDEERIQKRAILESREKTQ